MIDFVCRENKNGTIEIYNTKIGDIYFSNVGAYKEALEKFVLPSLPVINNNSNVKILDVCYGMGYNSKTFINYILKNNFNLLCEVDAIEIDKNILSLGLFIFDENISDDINLYFGQKILKTLELDVNIEKISGENWIKYIFDKFEQKFRASNQKSWVYLYQKDKISTFLHNIYYQNPIDFEKKFKFRIFCENLHEILPNFTTRYDLIFHDAFSILKQPDMWSEQIMNNYYNLLNPNGRLLTYSNSRVLRRTLEKVGFIVEINYDTKHKQNGTIAIKS